MDTPQLHPRAPWVAMLLAAVLLLTSVLAACRVTPSRPVRAYPERVTPASSALGPDLRIRMRKEADAASFNAPGTLYVYSGDDAQPRWSGAGPVLLSRTPSGYLLSPAGAILPNKRARIVADAGLLTLGAGTESVKLEGEIHLVARPEVSAGAFDVIEAIPIERYLPGVLAKELYHHFEPQAYAAQAIAARSYALHERARRAALGSHFDVEASTMDQAYAGAAAHPRAADAVRATRGRVLTWRGETLRAYYSSTCGDHAASARDTWPVTSGYEFNTAEPLQARPRACACASSPRHRWALDRPAAETADRLRAWGADAGHAIRKLASLRSIDAESRNEAGRPNRFRVTDSAGQRFSLSAEELRVALNTRAKNRPNITATTRVLSGDLRCISTGDTLRLTGRGFGHGVGLCQFGADGLAKQGLDHRDILARYYPGATITYLY